MNTEKLKVFCTEVALTIHQSQGVQIFTEEIIQSADMLHSYIRHGIMPRQINEEEKEKKEP